MSESAGAEPSPDTGLSNERTALAWQRTALSMVAGAAILARLSIDRVGVAAMVVLVAAALLALWVFAESRWRYAQQHGRRERARLRGGRAPAALTVATVLIALTEVAALTRAG